MANKEKIIRNLNDLLEAKLEDFVPDIENAWTKIENKLQSNQALFGSKIKSLASAENLHKLVDNELLKIEREIAKHFLDIDIYSLDGYKKFITQIFSWCPVDSHQGLFLKETSAKNILQDLPPEGIMQFFDYQNLDELFAEISPLDVLTISRYSESPAWQTAYKERLLKCQVEDFEIRQVDFTVFEYNKFHKLLSNSGQPGKPWRLSHNKVTGSIMCFNLDEQDIFEAPFLQYISVFIHYFFETAYAGIFYNKVLEKNPQNLSKAVLKSFTNHDGKFVFFHPNVYSETLYWQKALNLMIDSLPEVDFSFFSDTIDCGAFYQVGKRLSLNIVDHIWDVNIKEGPYLYHFEEAAWKNIFQEILNISDQDFDNFIINHLDMKDLEFTDYIIKEHLKK